MGEFIKVLGEVNIGKEKLNIELNRGIDDKIIHIQNDKIRYECSMSEFKKIASAIIFAKENLISYKRIDDDNNSFTQA
ncbi:hypothetical protein [Pseudobutyrivibrio xylanivorans]|uniref:Uncharacterized protein n=1 Tax=Pseudobutyrivibrio xylanivorans TaxID=185007 RepID=A0A1G5RPZ7_PSEXY|nr:hypothetical protein [Pseudobutyrivibrio xylanivorans]SCZ76074.1 hypothetical protein SAMN02910350_00065 [Pseudobutyrivibrio xylanivorans]